jgi:hypothetical protein
MDRSPGGVGDGLPSLPTGEPVLARWFAIAMIAVVLLGLAVVAWAFLSIRGIEIAVAERRPPGTAEVTHDRGDAALNQTLDVEPGPGCAAGIEMIGDEGARSTARRALSAMCQQLQLGEYPEVEAGLGEWLANDGLLRIAVFEVNGLDSSARVEDGRYVIELNAKFQFDRAALAAPFVMHELVHLGDPGWPGAPLSAEAELRAMEVQLQVCDALVGDPKPRGCQDARDLLADEAAVQELLDAGFRRGSEPR